jgi:hypothetical protein
VTFQQPPFGPNGPFIIPISTTGNLIPWCSSTQLATPAFCVWTLYQFWVWPFASRFRVRVCVWLVSFVSAGCYVLGNRT